MKDRILITMHLPMEMGSVGKIMELVSKEFPGCLLRNNADKNIDLFLEGGEE